MSDQFSRWEYIVDAVRDIGSAIVWGGALNFLSFKSIYDAYFAPDANLDGLFTISDIWLHFTNAVFATGDWTLLWLASTGVGVFFELRLDEPNAILSGAISFACWFILFAGFSAGLKKFKRAKSMPAK